MEILDLLFPKRCVNCGSFGAYVCADCINKLSLLEYQKCPMCCKRSVTGRTHKRCEKPLGMDGLVGGFAFDGVMRRMINKYKFSYVADLVDDLAEALISFADLEILLNNKANLIVPVPLHNSRLKERGYNQSLLISEKVSKYLQIKLDSLVLERKIKTKIQSGLVRSERIRNVRGAFKIKGRVSRKRVVLVDDVWTTGSTMRECAKTLKRNGAEVVWGLVLSM